ncbi:MAG TPA: glycosyl transferase [Kiritimatiellia bacterium]|nr:glycosyl transferase [Kiritimatiellia bacterium]HMO97615.1 glycosyl transferase [Kiritimatiellia bacterium]HMP95975.1 glycosyl transferase [Kiritimatiellia bacterium]
MAAAGNKAYGRFDDAAREYVIHRPDTPLPWLNYLGQDDFFALCTNGAGGYTFWRDAKLRRITRYRYNNLPMDVGARALYIHDGDAVWCPAWKPVKTPLDRYECRHGLGYTRFVAEKNGVEVEWLLLIPPGETAEVWRVRVRNLTTTARSIRLFSAVEFCLFEALNDMTNYQRTYSIGEVEVEGSALYHTTEYRERRNHFAVFSCSRPVDGFDTSRDEFFGVHSGWHEPEALRRGACANSIAHGWNPVGAHQLNLELPGGGTEEAVFVLGYVDNTGLDKFERPQGINKTRARALLARYATGEQVTAAYDTLRANWDRQLGAFQCACPDDVINRMGNIWNPYQCMATFNLSRSASGYETGIGRGMGFRDSNQDILGFVHMIPERARGRILDIAATQLSDGACYHQYQPLTKKGNADIGGDFYDDHLWLVLSTCAYVRETGDASILDAPVGYADTPGSGESLLHHLETSIRYTLTHLGPNGLPLIGHADWNDCLNLNCFSTEPNESFQTAGDVHGSKAESVMIAGLFLKAADDLMRLYQWLGRPDDAARMQGHHATMLASIEEKAWDGAWYRRAYDAEGRPVGSHENEEGQIFIESQGWCILGGAGRDNGRARQALDSVHERLFTSHGVVLQQPAYQTYHLHLGEVSSYPPGYKENAGIFCHNNTWIQIAWCMLGEGDRALEYYRSICPAAKESIIDRYRCEPYVYAQMIAGKDAPDHGEAKNSWLTGTAAWTFVVLSQYILGIQPDYEGLTVDPCISRDWPGFRVERRFRGALYDIEVKNPRKVCRGVTTMTVNGRVIAGNCIPIAPAGSRVRVSLELEG